MKNLLAAFLFSALLGPIPLSADVVFVSPDAVSASNTNHPLPVKPENLIDRSGLGAGNINVANIGTFAHSDGIAADLWRGSSSALPITLTFEFNNARQVGYVGLWQALDLREGTRDFELAFLTVREELETKLETSIPVRSTQESGETTVSLWTDVPSLLENAMTFLRSP